jgi:hypothetical protein
VRRAVMTQIDIDNRTHNIFDAPPEE